MKKILLLSICFFSTFVFAQTSNVGIGTTAPNANAILDIKATNKGVLLPRMDSVARKAIPNTKGLLVYDTTYSNFYFNTGTSWQKISGISAITNGSNPGDILYWNGSSWTTAPAGKPGQYLQFDTTLKPVWTGDQYPVITTLAVTGITDSSANLNLNLIRSGVDPNSYSYGDYSFEKGVVWSTSPNPVYDNGTSLNNSYYTYDTATVSGAYSYNTTTAYNANSVNLYVNTTYYVRAFAQNNTGTIYGNQVSFKTLNGPVSKPQVQNQNFYQAGDSAVLNGFIYASGGAPVTSEGFTWTSTSSSTAASTGSGTLLASSIGSNGTFTVTLKGLVHGNIYTFLAFATNSGGTGYDNGQQTPDYYYYYFSY